MSRDQTDPQLATTNAAHSSGPTIMVVDDNPLMRTVLQGLLSCHGYGVLQAANGEEASVLLKKQSVDLIICDIMMPRMGGFELHEKVRADVDSNHIPFIFLSALDQIDDVRRGKEVGVDDYLCKPFVPQDLLAVVRGKMARWKQLHLQANARFEGYQRRVLHTLSHEFRTPLVAINTGMELLLNHREALGTDKAKRLLEAVQRGGTRLEKLVGDFMVLQQLEAGVIKQSFEKCAETVSVAGLLQRHAAIRDAELNAEGFAIIRSDHSAGVSVRCIESIFIDCLERLFSNAIKFSQGRKEIEVHARIVENEVWFDVKDRGIGLDLSKVREALELFGQIDRGKLEQQGGGLGLSIAHHYALVHGGRLEFDNRDGGGAVVSLVVPHSSR